MFGDHVIGDHEHLVVAVANDDFAEILPAFRSGFGRRQDLQQALDFRQRVTSELPGAGDENGWRIVAMLRLAQQVRRADLGIDGFIGDHHGLGRSGEQVDADPTI
jgi:hypothetical protein